MKLSGISAVLLAYHEEAVIRANVLAVQQHLEKVSEKHEVIVVGYEGCKDNTNNIVDSMSKEDPRIRLVIQRVTEKGYGRAFKIGVEAARLDWVFQTDADGQYDISCLTGLVAQLQHATSQVDVVHGYRSPRQDPLERLFFAFCYNLALRFIYSIPLRDVDSAFKLIRRSYLEKVQIVSLSGFAVAEAMIRIIGLGAKTTQIPIVHLPRVAGEALSEKGIKNPFGLQLPNLKLVTETLGEMWQLRKQLKN